jgi:demethylmenaquinone methyltransferase/2-methoxy-6-polyprenyl-1,4-benzoquinol methylase
MKSQDAGPTAGKKERVRQMFDGIAGRYDFLNRCLSAGVDRRWRRRAIAQLRTLQPKRILDMATGTGELAIEALRLDPEQVVGIDLSGPMLEVGRKKLKARGLEGRIELKKGDSEGTDMEAGAFDAVTVAFGVRNFEDLDAGLSEMYRLLRPGGMAVVLEFSQPAKFPVKQLYGFYFHNILPFFGGIVSRDRAAYSYLPQSVSLFPYGESFLDRMRMAGFRDTKHLPLSFGIAAIYTGTKA